MMIESGHYRGKIVTVYQKNLLKYYHKLSC